MTSRRRSLAVLMLVVASVVAACGASDTSSAAPAGTPPSAESVATAPELTAPPLEGQTDTEWGRIWDGLPSGFPVYPGSTISEEAATGPASAVFVAPEVDPAAVAAWFQDALENATYSTEALSGPMEDGSYILESIGPDLDCRIEVTIAPLGGTISVTVLYGSECPND